MRIGLMGDTHQRFPETKDALEVLAQAGVKKVLHVGDFGFGGDKRGINYLDQVHEWAFERELTLYVTPGNHEDYTFLKSVYQSQEYRQWTVVRGAIMLAPRGLRWTWDGRTFVSLGGAGSVDRMWRLARSAQTNTTYWWRGEEITDADVEEATAGGHADVMITHEAPYYRAVEEHIAGNPLGFPQIDLEWADWNRQKLDEAAVKIMPKVLIHGHHHFASDGLRAWNPDGISQLSRIVGLNKETNPGSLAVLDTVDLSVQLLNA